MGRAWMVSGNQYETCVCVNVHVVKGRQMLRALKKKELVGSPLGYFHNHGPKQSQIDSQEIQNPTLQN